ncbi:transposase family protein (plasmid) [Shimia sp. W99]
MLFAFGVPVILVWWQEKRLCLNLCGVTILIPERSGGIVVNFKKNWAPCSEVKVDRVSRSESGSWVVSGVLAPKGICPDCGSRSRRRHGWRRRRIQDFPAHGRVVWVELRVCRWRCSNSGCRRSTFSDHDLSIAAPFTRRTSRVAQIASVTWGMLPAGDPLNVSCTDWALGLATTRSFGN